MEPSDHPRDVSHGTLNVHLLLEHSKAGKVIGTRGSMMQIIKGKSLVHSLKMEKEPKVNLEFINGNVLVVCCPLLLLLI